MGKITTKDTFQNVLTKMVEGNPGALTTLMELLDKHNSIDPESMLGGIGVILSLDDMEIYGSDIYIIYNDKCGRDMRKMLMLLRAVRLGFLSREKLKVMAADQMRQVNLTDEEFKDLDRQVCNILPQFAKGE